MKSPQSLNYIYFILLTLLISSSVRADTVVTITTPVGSFDILMLEDEAPLTVQNFLGYVNRGDYNGTFVHRSIPGFVVQGGGYRYDESDGSAPHIVTQLPVVNEFGISNTRGTVAMAKLGGDPNSATSEWFVNLGDNSGNLDDQNGGFTVFGRVLDDGMTVVDQIAALRI
ncbi:MAG: peptidyl-prolyl cis-trans isomerase A (cyclophilin A), partial [Candidatus Azotimanducaceae bacterium]